MKINMTNEEKKEYLSLKLAYQSTPFISEIAKKNYYLSKIPRILYKYRKFDEYTFDMIENEYVFLAPAGTLDDPFDCLTNIDLKGIYDANSSNLSSEMMEFIVDTVFSHPHTGELDKPKMLNMIEDSIVDGKIDNGILKNELDKNNSLSNEQRHIFLNTMVNFQNTIATITEDDNLKNLFMVLMQSKEKVGVCSFTTKRDNKPMWSLYADTYKGYCIEYETSFTKDILPNLCPVIYTKEFDNSIIKMMVKFSLEAIIRFATNGQMKTDIGCFAELTCTKDSDWEYQDEWRLVGEAKSKAKPLKIKNIYLGFDVSRENEDKILDYASKFNFGVYKMNKPFGTKEITYKKLK